MARNIPHGRLTLILLVLLLAGCSPAPTATPSATPTLMPTDTPIPTATPTQTATPLPTPTGTLTPLPTATATSPVLVEQGTPIPAGLDVISFDNAFRVSGLASFKEPSLTDLDWSPESDALAVATFNSIGIYSPLPRTKIIDLETPQGVVSIDYSPRGTLLAVGHRFGSEEVGYAGNVDIWRVSTWEALGPVLGGRQAVSQVAFSPDGKSLAAAFTSPASEDSRVVFWDTTRWEISRTLTTGNLQRIAFSPDSKLLAVSPNRYAVEIFRLIDQQLLLSLDTSFTGAVNSMAFSPDGSTLATGHYDGEIRLWNAQTGELRQVLATQGVVESLAFSPDGSLLASGEGTGSNQVRLWDIEVGQLVRILESHEHPLVSLAFSPDGRLLASGSSDGTVWLWGVRP